MINKNLKPLGVELFIFCFAIRARMHVQGPAYVFIAACVYAHVLHMDLYIQEFVAVYMCVLCTGTGETCIRGRVVEARAARQHAWLVQLVTLLITYLQALPPQKTIEFFTLPLQAVGCGLAAAQKCKFSKVSVRGRPCK